MRNRSKFYEFEAGLDRNYARMAAMLQIMDHDCKCHLKALNKKEEDEALLQVHRRAYVRSVFAFMEGLVFAMKQFSVWMGSHAHTLDISELVVLSEQSLSIKENGEIKKGYSRAPFLNAVRFSFRVFSKSMTSDFAPDFTGRGWQSVKKAVVVRDRLMHPKEIDDLVVTTEEVEYANLAYNWFLLSYSLCRLHNERTANLLKNPPKIDEGLEAAIAQRNQVLTMLGI